MGCRLDGKATVTTIYGLRRPLRAGAGEEDPELRVFGSEEKPERIIAFYTQKILDYCDFGIIAIGAKK
ncbi:MULTISPECIES: hypothetical protein [unclassified Leclercia]|uniref:Uncharacterized protein n=1 Tax=Leclercia barmai TaxID=2785629 RepID=A0ABS7RYR0_9ENTR|nr:MULTISPECIES: hypothetical protein [unclassified Leclercia]MBZ0059444.1 hypothetical protein [Leclercia sp. EMC7]MCM5697422.1 hypothetical protein [Leclercia sp. LTM01]